MTNPTIYRELVTNHNTVSCEGKYGRISIRKTCGIFRVTLERYDTHNINHANFKTLRGAELYFESAKDGLI
jgi:hypothetical protein